MSNRWDPAQYAKFSDHRNRPFADLLARVGPSRRRSSSTSAVCRAADPDPGRALAERAHRRRRLLPADAGGGRKADPAGRVEWVEVDLRDRRRLPRRPDPDVIVTNATLQWVPGHLDLLGPWVRALAPGGWLALQVPSNFDAPSHYSLRDVAREHPVLWLGPGLARVGVAEPAEYIEVLHALGCDVDAWETTYHQLLDPEGRQESPVLEWVGHRAAAGARRPHRRGGAQRLPGRVRREAARGIPADPGRGALPVPAGVRRRPPQR